MEQVESDIESLRASVFELKSSLYRADRAHSQHVRAEGMPLPLNIGVTGLLALFFLLL